MARGTLNPKKPNSANRNASALTALAHVLTDDGVTRGPSIEDATGRDDWDADVRRWYSGWQRAPQAQLFTSTDWARLAMLAPLVERYYEDPKVQTMAEIRMNEERLGATHTDRMRARMTVRPADEAAEVVPLTAVPASAHRASIASRMGEE